MDYEHNKFMKEDSQKIPVAPEGSAAGAGSAIFMWDGGGLNVLIPKRRGSGYLKCPIGHHRVAAIADIESDERVDMCGLDGHVDIEYGYREPEERRAIEERVLPRLAAHFGFQSWREDRAEFWRIVQQNTQPKPTHPIP